MSTVLEQDAPSTICLVGEEMVTSASQSLATYSFVLTGQTPLLMHADDVDQGDRLAEWRKAPGNKNISKAGDDRSPPWTWKTYCYSDGTHLTIPADNLMAALRYAGSSIILKQRKTFKAMTQSGLVFDEFSLPFFTKHPVSGEMVQVKSSDIDAIDGTFAQQAQKVKELGFSIFVKRAPVGRAKHVRTRPRFNDWEVRGTVRIIAKEITDDVILSLFEIAGNYAGLCDWRPSAPQSPGPYGRFQARLLKLAGTAPEPGVKTSSGRRRRASSDN